MSTTWLVVRGAEIKLRIPKTYNPEIRDGKLWIKTPKGMAGLADGQLAKADGVEDQVKAMAKAMQWDKIDPKYLAGPGESPSGLLVITEAEWTERQRERAAKGMWGKELRVSSNGKPVLQHDVRYEVSGEVVMHGYRWAIESLGQPFKCGWAHTTRYAYLKLIGPADQQTYADYAALLGLARDEEDRHREQFEKMMEDENNDGVRPPRATFELWRQLAQQIATANPRAELERRVRAQADTSPETTSGYCRRKAGEAAKLALDAGQSEAEVVAALESYKTDPSYQEAMWD